MRDFIKNHRFILLVLFLMISIALLYAGYQFTYINGEIVEDDTIIPFRSHAKNVQQLFDELQLTINSDDEIHPSVDSLLESNMTILLRRAADFVIEDAQEALSVRSTARTPEAILGENDFILNPSDVVTPGLQTRLQGGETISIDRVEYVEVSRSQSLPFQRFLRLSDEGEERGEVLREGENGELLLTYLQRIVNGTVVSEQLLSSLITQRPTHELLSAGVFEQDSEEESEEEIEQDEPSYEQQSDDGNGNDNGAPDDDSTDGSNGIIENDEDDDIPEDDSADEFSNGITFEATAYNIIGTTYSGVPSGPGKVATDPSVIPMGTRLYIESLDDWPDYGYAVAADTGGGIKGYKIDLFYYDYDTCIQFGRRNVRVYILD